MKKIVSLILAICVVAGILPLMVFAVADWALSGDTLTITGNDILTDVTAQWIGDSDEIKTVNIGADVTEIDNIAFLGCTNLTEIKVDENNANYKDIDGVLYTKDGETLVCYPAGKTGEAAIADGTTAIASYAFRSCAITGVTIPASVTSIGNYAFWGCENLATATIGSGVEEIGTWAFAYCDSLTAIEVDADNVNYADVDGVLYTDGGKTLVSYPADAATTTFAVPGTVTRIANHAFYGNNSLVTVTIPASVTSIGNDVFNYSGALTAVNVDAGNAKYVSVDGVLYSADETTLLYYPACKADTEFDVPATVTAIGKSAFENCDNLTTVNVSRRVTKIGYAAFAYCDALTDVNYAGTEVKWNMINTGSYWDRYLDGNEVKTTNMEFTPITNEDMVVSGTATKDEATGAITVGGGSANKAYLKGVYLEDKATTYVGNFQASHFALSATFKVAEDSETFSFVMGKDQGMYGYWVEVTVIDGKSYLIVHHDPGTTNYAPANYELGFDLTPGKEYKLVMTFDIVAETSSSKKQMVIELSGEDGEYYTCTTKANAYGNPFYYSNSDSCVVSDFTLSIDHYFDVEGAKIVVFGHSLVEADSLGTARNKGFAFLLEDEYAEKYGSRNVLNFGLGGDTVDAMYSKIVKSKKFIQNCEYALLCIGGNDSATSFESYTNRLQECIDILEEMGITPILCTIVHIRFEMPGAFTEINEWIRNSGYEYVDMYDIFANEDGSCKTQYFLSDKTHPTVEGHEMIYDRIKQDCPYLFN